MEKIGLEVSAQFDDVVLQVRGHQIEQGTVTLDTMSATLTANFEHTHEVAPFFFVVWQEEPASYDPSSGKTLTTQFIFHYGQTGYKADAGTISETSYDAWTESVETASLVLDGSTSTKKPTTYATNENINAKTTGLLFSSRFLGTYNWIACFDE